MPASGLNNAEPPPAQGQGGGNSSSSASRWLLERWRVAWPGQPSPTAVQQPPQKLPGVLSVNEMVLLLGGGEEREGSSWGLSLGL